MKKIKLAEIGEIVSGSTPSRANPDFWNGDIPWVSPYEINRLKSKYLGDTQEKITEAGFRSCSTKMLPKGSIIFSTRAPIGLIVIANIDVCTNQGFKSIIPNKDYLPEYVYYALKAHTKQLQSLGTGTTFLELSKKRFEEFKIPVPETLDDQIRIATLLSRAEGLIEKRRESLRLLDELVKGVFLEMFGDPVRNMKGWERKSVLEVSTSRLGKMLDGSKTTGEHLKPYLRNTNVIWFGFKLDDLAEMDFNEQEKIEFELKYGDILMCEGGEIGRCAIWKKQLTDCYYQKAIHRIRVNEKKINQEYFVYTFWFLAKLGGLDKFKGTATISHLTGEKLKQIRIPVPPIDLQAQFAATVQRIETLKAKYEASLKGLEELYGSLSGRAFRGELEKVLDLDINKQNENKEQKNYLQKIREGILLEKIAKVEEIDNLHRELHELNFRQNSLNESDYEATGNLVSGISNYKPVLSDVLPFVQKQYPTKLFTFQDLMQATKKAGWAVDFEILKGFVFELLRNGEMVQIFMDASYKSQFKAGSLEFERTKDLEEKMYLQKIN